MIPVCLYRGSKQSRGSEQSTPAFLVDETRASLEKLGAHVEEFNAQTFADKYQGWTKNRVTFVFPGGHTVLLAEELQEIIPRVRDLVLTYGCNYLGFCAGAALACEKMTNLNGELNYPDKDVKLFSLLHAIARQDCFDAPKWEAHNGPRMVKISAKDDASPHYALWNQGFEFQLPDPGAFPIARYAGIAKDPIASVAGGFGEGWVVAIGYHPEVQPSPVAMGRGLTPDEELQASDPRRMAFLRDQCVGLEMFPPTL